MAQAESSFEDSHEDIVVEKEDADSDGEQEPVAQTSKSPVRRSNPQRKRQKKDPNAPNRALSAYLIFLLAKQDEIRKANPDIQSVAEITRRVGQAWRNLSPEGHKIYAHKAEQDKIRYAQEMQLYTGSPSDLNFKSQLARLVDEAEKNSGKKSPAGSPASSKLHKKIKKVHNRGSPAGGSSSGEGEKRKRGRPRKATVPGTSEGSVSVYKKVKINKPGMVEAGPSNSKKKMRESSAEIGGPVGSLFMSPGGTSVSKLQELRVPILTNEFMEWNTRREKELRQVRNAAQELEIDVAGLRTQNDQMNRYAEEVAKAQQSMHQIGVAKAEVADVLLQEFAGVKLPSGMIIAEDNVDEYMAELEKATSRSPARNQELISKVREVAPKLQPYMKYLH